MPLTPDLEQALTMTADAITFARDPWWVIGSAAVALYGADVSDISDIDLLMSEADAAKLMQALGEPFRHKEPNSLFRSTIIGCWTEPPLTVEIMGGFEVATDEGWERVWPRTRQPAEVRGRTLFIPSAAELKAMLVKFGRPKDLARARLL
ncbi:MAG TPA: hypothetical protein VFK50_03075 [Sphingomicrobium sp.]|nr:hypothetical protein [Sphingomicrobium sp.]